MVYRLAADGVLLLHMAFILFAVFGALLAMRWRCLVVVHLPAVAWAFYVELTGRICPLTYAENTFRVMAGQSGYRESFVEHYLLPIIYPSGLTIEIQFANAIAVVVINAVIYGWLYYSRHRSKRSDA